MNRSPTPDHARSHRHDRVGCDAWRRALAVACGGRKPRACTVACTRTRVRTAALACPWALQLACASASGPPTLPPPIPDLVAANEALGDPYGGRFPLTEALAGLPAEGELHARLVTDEGEIDCTLDPRHAPLTVANFVGLARGLRPFQHDDGSWQAEPYYEGLAWHRAEEGQFVQTGRRGRQATGGFLLQDEISFGDSFDRGGVLAMANTGEEHSGSVQFFVTTGPVPHLEGDHTIFGQCDDEATVRALERRVARGGSAPMLQRVEITRR